VQITVCVLHQILVDDTNYDLERRIFIFGSRLNNILAIVRRKVSKLLVLLNGAGVRTFCLTYFKYTALLHCIFSIWSLN